MYGEADGSTFVCGGAPSIGRTRARGRRCLSCILCCACQRAWFPNEKLKSDDAWLTIPKCFLVVERPAFIPRPLPSTSRCGGCYTSSKRCRTTGTYIAGTPTRAFKFLMNRVLIHEVLSCHQRATALIVR